MEEYAVVSTDLEMKYAKDSVKVALRNLNLKLHKNEMIGLIGANGSGKTTFFKLCSGVLEPTRGKIEILGGDAVGDIRLKEEVIYSMHALPIDAWKAHKVLQSYSETYPHFDLEFARKSLELFDIPVKKTIKTFSQGMKSIFHFICAIATRCEVTMLDEPFIGIDIEKRKLAYEILLRDYMENPRTFIISSHNLSELEAVLSEMVLIDHGNLIFYEEMDTVREMLFRADGSKEQIAAFEKNGGTVYVNRGELGSFFIGRGSVESESAKEAKAAGLSVSAVAPEDVCVYLTSGGRERDLECLWK